jgi:hypothetical protein
LTAIRETEIMAVDGHHPNDHPTASAYERSERARCGNAVRRDRRGGRRATGVPTLMAKYL